MIEDDTTNKSRVSFGSVLHLHDLDHVEIRWFAWLVEGENSIDDNLVPRHCIVNEPRARETVRHTSVRMSALSAGNLVRSDVRAT